MPGSSSLLWVDQHRPTSFDALTYHDELTARLRGLCTEGDVPHLLFYGPSGGGKRTRIACILRELFGSAVERKKVAHKVFKLGANKKELEITTVNSQHHVEVNPSDCGITYDRIVVQELIKDMASAAPLEFTNNNVNNGNADCGNGNKKGLKIIVLHEVDQMSKLAQQALRRTMEKYSSKCRIIMVCENFSRVIEPLRSRCLGIRVGLPTPSDIKGVLETISAKEGLEVSDNTLDRIIVSSERNLRRAVLQLEATKVSVGNLNLPDGVYISRADWEHVISDIAKMLSMNQSANQLLAIRKKFQDLISHAVPPDVILRRLLEELMLLVDDEITPEIIKCAADFDHNLVRGTKPLFHLEACVARLMLIYSNFLKNNAMMIS